MRSAPAIDRRAALLIKNVKNSELFSHEWCDLIFQHRNKDYGAYQLRRRIGRRYRFALIVVVCGVLLTFLLPVGITAYMRYRLQKELVQSVKDIRRLKKLEEKPGYELKRISTGRRASAVRTVKGGTEQVPEIAEITKQDIVFGVDGPDLPQLVLDDLALEDHDTLHNRDRTDLPVEGPQLTAVEVVEEMPQFPGGPKALMEWLDKYVPYPPKCIEQGIEGDAEVSFIVTKEGRVRDPEVTKPLHPDLDRDLLRVLQRMPRWTPGKSGGRVADVRVTIPIHFQIR